MTLEQKRAAYPLISTSPNYGKYLAARRRESIISRLLSPVTAVTVFVREYGETFAEVLNPSGNDLHFGPGK